MERKGSLIALFIWILLGSWSAQAQLSRQVVESFTSTANFSSTTAVWNTARGEIHPQIYVDSYDDGGGATNLPIDVGDGSDGSFSSLADYQRYGTVSGGTIYLDTDSYPDLQFTNVNILAGYTLTSTGSNPILMRVLGNVVVNGDIYCSGTDGADGGSGGANLVNAGGTSYCGGGDGGDSSNTAGPGATNYGEDGGAFVTGGSAGPIATVNSGQGGGGGGAYIKAFVVGPDYPDGTAGTALAPGAGGAVGTRYRDDAFVDDLDGAGSGGGGGSAYATDNSNGGGGGAGGGALLIYAAGDITNNGNITANGGDGGDVNGGLLAGAGGGGGGGSILMMTVGDITNNGIINAFGGAGGTGGGGGTNGGNGFYGRTWLVEKDGFAGGTPEDPDTQLNVVGDVRYETGVSYTTTSGVIDLLNTDPTITALPINISNLGGAALTYEVAFGETPTDASLSAFAVTAGYIGLQNGRYARFRIQLDNTNGLTPATVTDLSFDYDGNKVDDFEFVGSCGSVGSGGVPPWTSLMLLLPMLLIIGFRRYHPVLNLK